MTDNEIRIAIAEACKWEFVNFSPDGSPYGWPPNGLPRSSCVLETLPDYPHDLNAMRTAVMSQPDQFRVKFQLGLDRVSSEKKLLPCELSARDWAKVFLETHEGKRV